MCAGGYWVSVRGAPLGQARANSGPPRSPISDAATVKPLTLNLAALVYMMRLVAGLYMIQQLEAEA